MTQKAMLTTDQEDLARIAAEAADWFVRLDDCTEAERRRFSEWLIRSPSHIEEFLRMSGLSHELHQCAKRPETTDEIDGPTFDYSNITPLKIFGSG